MGFETPAVPRKNISQSGAALQAEHFLLEFISIYPVQKLEFYRIDQRVVKSSLIKDDVVQGPQSRIEEQAIKFERQERRAYGKALQDLFFVSLDIYFYIERPDNV
jgi:hypothetical protein